MVKVRRHKHVDYRSLHKSGVKNGVDCEVNNISHDHRYCSQAECKAEESKESGNPRGTKCFTSSLEGWKEDPDFIVQLDKLSDVLSLAEELNICIEDSAKTGQKIEPARVEFLSLTQPQLQTGNLNTDSLRTVNTDSLNTAAVARNAVTHIGNWISQKNDGNKGTTLRKTSKRGRKPAKIDVKAKLERSRQSARECRARKKLRYQYLEELVSSRERSVFQLRTELEQFKKWAVDIDEGKVPPDLEEYMEKERERKERTRSESSACSYVMRSSRRRLTTDRTESESSMSSMSVQSVQSVQSPVTLM